MSDIDSRLIDYSEEYQSELDKLFAPLKKYEDDIKRTKKLKEELIEAEYTAWLSDKGWR